MDGGDRETGLVTEPKTTGKFYWMSGNLSIYCPYAKSDATLKACSFLSRQFS